MKNNFNILILAGGFGTRLQSVVNKVPKPMAPIENKPFLDYQIELIREYFPNNKIYLLTHYLSEVIEEYYKNDFLIKIIKEEEPLGTGGCIKNAIKELNLQINSSLLVFNGDTYIKPDLEKFVDSEAIQILASYQEKCDRYGTLRIQNQVIKDFLEKKEGLINSYINAGCYFFNDLSFFQETKENKFNIEDKFKQYLNNNDIKAFLYKDIFIDIGIPMDYKKMIDYIQTKGL